MLGDLSSTIRRFGLGSDILTLPEVTCIATYARFDELRVSADAVRREGSQ